MSKQVRHRLLDTSAIVVGYAMSRLDSAYLATIGKSSWTAAFDHAGRALGVAPASLKNLRDEFDPIHPNSRQGWRKRPLRKSRQRVLAELCEVSDAALMELVQRVLREDQQVLEEAIVPLARPQRVVTNAAERLLTGRRAEEYFLENSEPLVGVPKSRLLDRRSDACGYDFGSLDDGQTAFEVKGIKGLAGNLLFTDREWHEASRRRARYLVVVVGMLDDANPIGRVFADPTTSLPAKCRYQQAVVAQWIASAQLT